MKLNKLLNFRFAKVPLFVKFLALISLTFLFISFNSGKQNSFIELPVVEDVYAEGDVSDKEKKITDDIEVKKKIEELDLLIKEAKAKERERSKVLEDFIESLKIKEEKFNLKNNELDLKEENLKSVKRDIESKLQELSLLKAEVEVMVDKQRAESDGKVTKLAKVYEAAPAEQAGALLSKLDTDIAAKILLKMNSRKAGAAWGFVEPSRAALISKKLAIYNAGKK